MEGQLKNAIAKAQREGGNIVVDVDVDDYRWGVEELLYSVVGFFSIPKVTHTQITL